MLVVLFNAVKVESISLNFSGSPRSVPWAANCGKCEGASFVIATPEMPAAAALRVVFAMGL